MKLLKILLISFLFLIPLALATTTFTLDSPLDGENYASGATVNIIGICSAGGEQAAFQLVDSSSNTVWVTQLDVPADGSISESYVPTDGDYTLYGVCLDASITETFCVGDSCSQVAPAADDTGSGGGGSGGSSGCVANWSCTGWSYCNNNLEKTRTCGDYNYCGDNSTIPEIAKSCDACDESWVCSLWGDCSSSNKNSRTCIDEHYCSTTALKPSLTKSCDEDDASGYAPSSVSPTMPSTTTTTDTEQYTPPTDVQEPSVGSQFTEQLKEVWSNYSYFIVAIPAILIILIVGLSLYLRHSHKQKPASNMDQLHTYVKEEAKSGMSKEDIRKNLQTAGWNDEEIANALDSLDEGKAQAKPPAQ